MFKKPIAKFEFTKIKVLIKCNKTDSSTEVLLDREWAKLSIPHFRKVIDNVPKTEGIEITLTCSAEAFNFAVDYLKASEQDHI